MNEIIKNIITRRSTRSYEDRPIPEEILDDIITAGLYAPSAMNTQPWLLTVVRDEEKLEALRAAIEKSLDRKGYGRFYNAPVLIIVTVPDDYRHGKADTACVLENMFLAAHSLGVGSVWINQLNDCCDNKEVREILTTLGIPQSHTCHGSAALGYPSTPPTPTRQNKGKVNYT